MDIYELIENRQSIRNYKDKEVEEEKLDRILEAGRKAPSAKNIQPWKFIVTRKNDLKQKLVKACHDQKFMGEADIILTIAVNIDQAYKQQGEYMSSFAVDGSIAMDHMMLAATAEGLGTCWIGAFSEEEVKEVLGIPKNYRVVGLTPIGYIKEKSSSTSRKSLEEIVVNEKWN